MGSKQVLWNCKMMRKVRKTTAFQVKCGGFMVAGEGFEPPTSGLWVLKMPFFIVLHRVKKPWKHWLFWILRLVSFCNFVELFVMELNFCWTQNEENGAGKPAPWLSGIGWLLALLFDGFEQLHKPLLFLVCQLGYVPLGFLTRHAAHLLSPAIIRP